MYKELFAYSYGYSFIEVDYRKSNPSLVLDRFINSFKIYRNCKNTLAI
jgi:hypothetical protein